MEVNVDNKFKVLHGCNWRTWCSDKWSEWDVDRQAVRRRKGHETRTEPSWTELVGDERSERARRQTKSDATGPVPSHLTRFGLFTFPHLTPSSRRGWVKRGTRDTKHRRGREEEGTRRDRYERREADQPTHGIKLTVSFTLESYHIKLLIFYFYFLVHFIIIIKIRSFMIIIKELYL